MTRDEMITKIEALGDDASWYTKPDGTLSVTIEDFEGFDDDWSEVERDFDDAQAVEDFTDMLEEEALSQEGDFYTLYHFEGFDVELGYASFDI